MSRSGLTRAPRPVVRRMRDLVTVYLPDGERRGRRHDYVRSYPATTPGTDAELVALAEGDRRRRAPTECTCESCAEARHVDAHMDRVAGMLGDCS